MELFSLLSLMKGCNPEATLDISTNCDHEVALRWNFMGISHTVKHLKVGDIRMQNIPFQRSLHRARMIMRCRMHLRKLYQNNPEIHAQMMKGKLK